MVDIVTIRYGDFEMTIAPQKLPELRLKQIRGIFKLLRDSRECWGSDRNVEAVGQINEALDALSVAAKEEWRGWSRVYQSMYIDLKFCPICSTEQQLTGWLRRAEAQNRRLFTKVKRAKARYDRIEKIKKIFQETIY